MSNGKTPSQQPADAEAPFTGEPAPAAVEVLDEVRGVSYWQIVWRQFRKNTPAMVGLVMVLLLFLLAVFAPLLANKYPYFWYAEDEGLSFPLFQSLTNMDLTLLAAFFLAVLVPLTRRLLRRTRWEFWSLYELRRAVLVNFLVFLLVAAALVNPPVGNHLRSILLACAVGLGLLLMPLVAWMLHRGARTPESSIRVAVAVNLYLVALAVCFLAPVRVVPDRIFIDVEEKSGGQVVTVRREREYKKEIDEGIQATYLFPPIRFAPTEVNIGRPFESPSAAHVFGTDSIGRSAAARMLYATRTSLAVGFISVSISVMIGLVVGGVSAYFGGKVDLVLQRVVEVFICFPTFFLMLMIIAFYGPKLWLIMLAIGMVGWSGIARLSRAEILRIRTLDYVTAARALGLGSMRIILRHAVPNGLAPVLVSATFGIAGAVAFEAALSFLGLGDPNHPSWGNLLSQARRVATEHPMLLIIPGIAIFFAVLGYNLVGEGLRDAIDPRLKV